jgi:hypothetical protein
VVCDFQAIYQLRINPQFGEFADLSGYELLRYASRLPAYQGAVANEIARITLPDRQAQEEIPLTHPDFADLIEFS